MPRYILVSRNPFNSTLCGDLYGSGTFAAAGPGLEPRQPGPRDHILLITSTPSMCSDGSPGGQKEVCKTPIMSSLIVKIELTRSQSRLVLCKNLFKNNFRHKKCCKTCTKNSYILFTQIPQRSTLYHSYFVFILSLHTHTHICIYL